MKINHRIISIIIIIVLSISVLAACTPTVVDSDNNEILLQNAGFTVSKTIKDEKNFIQIGENGSTIDLEVLNQDLYNSIEEDEFYIYTYNSDNILKSLSKNQTIKGPYLKSMEQGVETVDELATREIPSVAKLSVEGLTILDEYEYDFKGNGEMAKIVTYTNAEKDENGEIMWDDGQRWLIVVHNGDVDYVLFDDYVQLGQINSYIYTIEDDFYIATLSSGTANLTLKSYLYDRTKDMFIETIPFNTQGNVNMMHSTFGF